MIGRLSWAIWGFLNSKCLRAQEIDACYCTPSSYCKRILRDIWFRVVPGGGPQPEDMSNPAGGTKPASIRAYTYRGEETSLPGRYAMHRKRSEK